MRSGWIGLAFVVGVLLGGVIGYSLLSSTRAQATLLSYELSAEGLQEIRVLAGLSRLDSINFVDVREDANAVRITVDVLRWRGAVPADMKMIYVPVTLAQPLGTRSVVDDTGKSIPLRTRAAPPTQSASPTAAPTPPRATATSSAAQSSPSPDAYTPPPLNPRETKVIRALATLGIRGMRAQLPFDEATIWARGEGWLLFVGAYPTATMRGEFSVIDERRLEGVRVQRVQYSGPPPRQRFECVTDTYEVSGDVPPGFADMDALVGRFIRALGCAA
jgi:hypothetical protein